MTLFARMATFGTLAALLVAGSRSVRSSTPPAADKPGLNSAAASGIPNTVSNSGLDLTKLPLGDGKIATAPEIGYVYSCQTNFNGPGPDTSGPWVDSSAKTFNFAAKSVVQGSVAWPNAAFTIALNSDGALRNVSTNDLPSHTTGTFPIAPTDPGYKYDFNPNHIDAQTIVYSMAGMPTVAGKPACVSLGPIGVMLSGSLLFNALDGKGRDAVAHEEQDHCQGHPDPSSTYHYHSLTTCIDDPGTGHSNLLGYALDGFGIYGVRGENGKVLTNADLDECHGHTHTILWDGKTVTMYHYHATYEYPYSIGCFKGTPVRTRFNMGGQHNGPPGNRPARNGPPGFGPPNSGPQP